MSYLLVGAFSFGAAPSTDQGIWKYDLVTTTWTHVYPGVHNNEILNLAITPDKSLVIAGVDGTIPRIYSLDQGVTWAQGGTQYNNTGSGPFGVIGVGEDKSLYDSNFNGATSTYQLLKTTDFGVTWTPLYDLVHGGFNFPLTIWFSRGHLWWTERWSSGPIKNSIIRDHVSVVDIAYTGNTLIRGLYGSDLVWVWGNTGGNNRSMWNWDGTTLTDLSANLPAPTPPWTTANQQLFSLVPFDANTLFLADWLSNGATDPTPNNYCKIWRSLDGGGTWTLVLDDTRAVFGANADGTGTQFITQISPTEYALVAKGGIFHSINGGATWTFISGPSTTIEFSTIGAIITAVSTRRRNVTLIGAT